MANKEEAKVAIITGGGKGGGIGYGLSTAFAKAGYNLVITGRGEKKLADAKEELERLHGIHVLTCQADGGVEEQVAGVIAKAVEAAQAESAGTGFSTSEEQAKAYDDYIAGLSGKYEGKTLNIVTVSDPWLTGMEETVTKFEELTGCKVSFSELGYDACYSKETLIASQNSNEADVFIYDYPWIGALSDSLMELDDVLDQNAALVAAEIATLFSPTGISWGSTKSALL